MQAMIVAGGRGVRLRPITDSIPKSLILINNKPLIQLTYEAAIRAKVFDSIYITTDSKKIKNITEKFGIPAYVLADTTWGTCDLNSNAGKILGTGIQFNIGHTINTETIEKNVVLIAFEKIKINATLVQNNCYCCIMIM